MLGSDFSSFFYLPASNTRGGILVAVCAPEISLQLKHQGNFSIALDVSMDDHIWCLTSVLEYVRVWMTTSGA